MKTILRTLIFLVSILSGGADAKSSLFFQDLSQTIYYQPKQVDDCHRPGLDHSQWPQTSLSQLSEFRRYCLRVPIRIDGEALPLHTQLQVYALATNRVYWDGEYLGQSGIVGDSRESETTGPISLRFPMSSAMLSPGEHLLSIDMSTFHHLEDMHQIFYAIALVDGLHLSQLERYQLIPPLMLMGAMLLLFIFFQLMFWFYQRDLSFVYFSLLCLFAGVLIGLEILKYFYTYPWDMHIIRLRAMFVVSTVTSGLLVLYYQSFYRNPIAPALLLLLLVSVALIWFLGISYDARSATLFLLAMLISLAICIKGIIKGRHQSKTNTAVLVLALILLFSAPNAFIDKWFAALFSIIAISNLYSLMHRFNSDRKRALASLKLETEMLRRNLQPHFLMNSLMLIVEWVETQPQLAVEFIEALAEEFRLLTQLSQRQLVRLQDELSLCQLHFKIMTSRYQKDVQLEVSGGELNAAIPPAILHTIIENAFSHNKVNDRDVFKIKVVKQDKRVEVQVFTPFRSRQHAGSGTGERYIAARLTEQFEDNWRYQSSAVDETIWCTSIQFPFAPKEEK